MASPRVSICIPNLDMAPWVAGAIESALSQTCRDLEVVVVDNASRDGSWEVIQGFARRDARVRAFRNDATLPMPVNWNACLSRARGETVNLLSADDELHPEFAARCLALHERFPSLGYAFTHTSRLDAEGRERVPPPFFETSAFLPGLAVARLNLVGSHNGPSEMLIHRERLLALGGFDAGYQWAHDARAKLALNLRWDAAYWREPLCRYRVHPGNSTARIHRTKLGVMELYRLKLDVLENLPPHARQLEDCREDVLRNLSRLCSSYAEWAFARSEPRLGSEYMHLAASFSLEPERRSLPDRPGPPYPLPAGARRLDTTRGWKNPRIFSTT